MSQKLIEEATGLIPDLVLIIQGYRGIGTWNMQLLIPHDNQGHIITGLNLCRLGDDGETITISNHRGYNMSFLTTSSSLPDNGEIICDHNSVSSILVPSSSHSLSVQGGFIVYYVRGEMIALNSKIIQYHNLGEYVISTCFRVTDGKITVFQSRWDGLKIIKEGRSKSLGLSDNIFIQPQTLVVNEQTLFLVRLIDKEFHVHTYDLHTGKKQVEFKLETKIEGYGLNNMEYFKSRVPCCFLSHHHLFIILLRLKDYYLEIYTHQGVKVSCLPLAEPVIGIHETSSVPIFYTGGSILTRYQLTL